MMQPKLFAFAKNVAPQAVSSVERSAGARKDAGFGLIELMVSMAIASFLVLGLVAMSGSMQSSYVAQTNGVAVHDKERFASSLFGAMLQSGGYFTVTYNSNSTTVPSTQGSLPAVIANNPPGAQYGLGQFMSGSGAAGGLGPDVLNVRYIDTGTDVAGYNCLGRSSNGAGIYESVLSVDTTHNTLVCQVGFNNGTPAGTIGGASGTSTVLMDGVTNMQIFYDVTAADPTTPTQLQYFRSIDMTAGLWNSVRSVQIILTLQDPTTTATSKPYTFIQTYQVMYELP